MNKFKATLKVIGRFVDDNLPTILSVIALGGLGMSVGTAIKETPAAQDAIIEAKKEKVKAIVSHDEGSEGIEVYDISNTKLTPWEGFKVLAPIYWPCAVSTLATVVCIVGSNVVSKKRYLGLAALVATQSDKFKEYQDKVKEIVGEKKEKEVQKEIAKDQLLNCPREIDSEGVNEKPIMCFCGRYWRATQEEVKAVFNKWNQDALQACTYPLNGDDGAKVIDEECEMHLESLLDDYLAPTFRINFPDTWAYYKRMTWDITNGIVEPHFEPGETGFGHLGYYITPTREPDHLYGR